MKLFMRRLVDERRKLLWLLDRFEWLALGVVIGWVSKELGLGWLLVMIAVMMFEVVAAYIISVFAWRNR